LFTRYSSNIFIWFQKNLKKMFKLQISINKSTTLFSGSASIVDCSLVSIINAKSRKETMSLKFLLSYNEQSIDIDSHRNEQFIICRKKTKNKHLSVIILHYTERIKQEKNFVDMVSFNELCTKNNYDMFDT
jgi:hypothetical protein